MPDSCSNPDRIDPIIELLQKKWKSYPNMRLMQLLINVIDSELDPFYVDDQDLERWIRDF